MTAPAGWYDDGSGSHRWWDGAQWTSHIFSAPQAAEAVVEAPTDAVDLEPFAPPYVAHPGPRPVGITANSPAMHPGYPGASQGPAPSPPAPRRSMSVLGLIGLITAVIAVVLACIPPIAVAGWILLGVAVVLSIVSLFLRGAKWPGITGIGVTMVGAVLAGAIALVSVGLSAIVEAGENSSRPDALPSTEAEAPSTDTPDASAVDGAEMVTFDELAVGDCIPLFDYGDADDVYELPVVPCDVPHTDEVYFTYEAEDGEFPGDDALFDSAWERCLGEFEAFVGVPYADSELDLYSYQPTKSSWTRFDDRTVHCIVFSYDDVTGSLQGVAR